MAQAKKSRPNGGGEVVQQHLTRGLREGTFLMLFFLAAYLILILVSYHPEDSGWSHRGAGAVHNLGGRFGAWLADLLLLLFGYPAYLFAAALAWGGWAIFRHNAWPLSSGLAMFAVRGVGLLLTLLGGGGLATLHFTADPARLPEASAGGVTGSLMGGMMVETFGLLGGTLLLLVIFLTGLTLFAHISWLSLMDTIGGFTLGTLVRLRDGVRGLREVRAGRRARQEREQTLKTEKKKRARRKPVKIEPVITELETSERVEREKQQLLFDDAPADSSLPPISLLDPPPKGGKGYSSEGLEAMSRQVELKLADFGIEVQVESVHPGPVITRFELMPAPGVKVSQISNLAKDLARALSAVSVRVVDVIPGKPTVGLEIPNQHRETVGLSEILASEQYDRAGSPLSLALGKDISGRPVVVDLARMPHLLVAGTTGSGKSVAINAMLLSLLYKATAREVRLIMIDPKMLELSVYEGIPHLLTPVVTDMKDAANALRWCVGEMERRYRLMAALGVRNLGGYNRKVKEAIE
ncbi:MAG TPA: DNA translocase FtsK, partial [Thiotrichales bacterium]|nr:DNA translocase FtsK [Thiotrichales bacterium]